MSGFEVSRYVSYTTEYTVPTRTMEAVVATVNERMSENMKGGGKKAGTQGAAVVPRVHASAPLPCVARPAARTVITWRRAVTLLSNLVARKYAMYS